MKISYNWLQEYFDKKLPSPEELGKTLTLKALEVEKIEEREGDHILNIDVLPNRAHDALSYIGIAKEVAVLFDLPLKLPEIKYDTDKKKSSEYISLEVDDSKLVPRAMKRVVLDVKVGESPDWLKERLISMEQKPINNIVDITNFVMWETGQPVHAFDLDKIVDGKIIIRGAHKDEKITTLDNIDYVLKEGMLVIADPEKPLDIAGIKGGASSGIDENTKRIVLSVCSFDQTWIRDTSRTLKLKTDASWRFQNGISTVMPEMAMDRLSQLVSEIVGGNISEEILDNYPKDVVRTSAPYKIGVSLEEVNKVLGSNMKNKDVEDILNRLSKYAGFKWEKVSPLKKVLEEAKKYEGVPYKYGASITFDAPNYFDCSSFVSYVFINTGIALPRRTVDQFVYGEEVKDLSPGDIVFSKSNNSDEEIERLNTKQSSLYTESVDFMKGTKVPGGVSHNGIYLGDGKIAHAAGNSHKGKVVIEDLKETSSFKNVVGYRRILLNDNDRYVVEIPHERLDLRAGPGYLISGNKEDLIEEIGRIYGYMNIQSSLPKDFPFKPKVNKSFYYQELIKDILVENGFSEVITYSFQNEGKVKLANPLSSDKKYLRENLRGANKNIHGGLLESLELNTKNTPLLGLDEVKIFEIGKIFKEEKEEMHLGIAIKIPDKYKNFDEEESLLKSEAEKIIDVLFSSINTDFKLDGSGFDFRIIVNENIVGSYISHCGIVFTIQTEEHKVFGGTIEINLDSVIENLPDLDSYNNLKFNLSQINKFKHISPYPFVLRDISVWVPNENISDVGPVFEEIKKEFKNLLVKMRLFDAYRKGEKTSFAFKLTFQSDEKTLSDNEINKIMKGVENSLNNRPDWEVR